MTPHKFRHTFARSWLERGGEVYSLSRLLGHSSVKVTETYLEDFTSRQARVHHVKFSALNDLKVRKQGAVAISTDTTSNYRAKRREAAKRPISTVGVTATHSEVITKRLEPKLPLKRAF